MTFVAHLKRTSTIWHAWVGAHRTSGEIGGATFRLVRPSTWESGPLTDDQVAVLRHHASVELFTATNPARATVDELVDTMADGAVDEAAGEVRTYPNRFSSSNQPRRGKGR